MNSDLARSETAKSSLAKVPTHVAGLDEILHGGLPEGRTTLLVGGPGSGKTMLSLETLWRLAASGRPVVHISFEESADDFRANARSLGWDIGALEKKGLLTLLRPGLDYRAVRSGEFSIKGLLAVLAGQAKRIGARLIVIDAADVLMRLFESPARRDEELYNLHDWLAREGYTAILTVKSNPGTQDRLLHTFLEFLADCVIFLDQRIHEQVVTRRLRVIKYRGSSYIGNECPFVITPEGVVFMPVSSTELLQQVSDERVSSGHSRLDEMLGGGFRRGSSILIGGPTGSGKTTLACTFACRAGERGERTLYVSFEESEKAVVTAMKSPGLDLAAVMESGRLKILTSMPESMGIEEHLLRIVRAAETFEPQHLVVDAISAAGRMGSESAGFDLLVRLLAFCRRRGITCIYLNQTAQREPVEEISGFGISSLIDTALILDYLMEEEELRRTLLVLKSRGSGHSNLRHRLRISGRGLLIDPPTKEGAQTQGG